MARSLQPGFAGLKRTILLLALIFANYAFIAAQDDSIYRLPAGTRIKLKLDVELSSKVASVGDTFTAAVAKPVVMGNVAVLSAGTIIEGRVAGVTRAGLGGSGGKLDIVFDKLWLSREIGRPIDAALVKNLQSRSSPTRGVLGIIGGTVIGAVFGGLAKSSSGALIGAGVGAGIGTGVALAKKGKDVRIARNEEFEIVLRKEIVLPIVGY